MVKKRIYTICLCTIISSSLFMGNVSAETVKQTYSNIKFQAQNNINNLQTINGNVLEKTSSVIYVEGEGKKVILKITDETKIVDEYGKSVKFEDLVKNDSVEVDFYLEIKNIDIPVGTAKKIIVKQKYRLDGFISEVNGEEAKIISVKGEALTEDTPNFIDLIVNENTKIVDENNKSVSIKNIKEGVAAEIIFNNKWVNSKTTMGIAEKIVIKNKIGTDGEIVNINKYNTQVEIKRTEEDDDNIILKINSYTNIYDLEGNTIKAEDLEEGAKIIAIHSKVFTRSTPPQTNAYKIIVIENGEDEEEKEDEIKYLGRMNFMGYITRHEKYGNSIIYITNHSKGKNKHNYAVLTIDKDTKIVDVRGNTLTFDQLINNKKQVKVEFDIIDTSINSVIGKATKIVVQGKPIKVDNGKGHKNNKK